MSALLFGKNIELNAIHNLYTYDLFIVFVSKVSRIKNRVCYVFQYYFIILCFVWHKQTYYFIILVIAMRFACRCISGRTVSDELKNTTNVIFLIIFIVTYNIVCLQMDKNNRWKRGNSSKPKLRFILKPISNASYLKQIKIYKNKTVRNQFALAAIARL